MCFRERPGICCFGCSTSFGIHLIALLTLAEVALISYIFGKELKTGVFSLKIFTWLSIVVFRTLAYLQMCCDSINKRWIFLWSLVGTTAIEALLFVLLNVGLFDGTDTEVLLKFVAAWGMGTWVQIFFIELLSIVHLGLFCYFSYVAHEYYTMARDDPVMIDKEHREQAEAEKKTAIERKKAQLDK